MLILRIAIVALWLFAATTAVRAEPRAMPIQVDASRGEFTMIVLPDTQRYSSEYPAILRSQLQWVRDAAKPLNTQMAVHVGDIVDDDSRAEWMMVDGVFELLDDAVPYLVVPGNHDFNKSLKDKGMKSASNFNAVFSPYRFNRHPWYGGHYGATGNNSFSFFEAAGQKYMVLGLEFGPSDAVLDWAANLIKKHKDSYRVILVTHAYMDNDDTRLGEGDESNPHNENRAWNDGEEIWAKLIKRQANIDLVVSGHVLGDGTGFLISKTDSGAPVVQMLANYQTQDFGGGGWLRILKFRPLDKQIDVFTYSPWYGRLRTEPDQQFTIPTPWMFSAAAATPPAAKPKP